ncbi:MAG: HEPN domain-containing protein [Candidatus Bathyarchaeota archaeon]|nr:HEPN domain-containing protein [Candidatus Bathyarchaeota archaeon]
MLSDSNLWWCLRQKHGIRIISPNLNLTKAYLKKSVSALNTMNAAIELEETDWITTTAYYARYFALYALLMKIGIKSEIHDCTINLALLLAKNNIIDPKLAEELDQAKNDRIETQYYVEQEQTKQATKNNAKNARHFVLEIEKTIENITPKQIASIRRQLKPRGVTGISF